mgnify:CR=1 FL=1
MKIKKVINKLELEVVSGFEGDDKEVKGVYIGDLLSIVMSKAKKNQAWITVQTHINTVAIASLVELSCIIVVEGMDIDKDTIEKSNELGIPILKTNKSAYEISSQLYELGI